MTPVFIAGAAILVGAHLWAIIDAVRAGRRWLWVIALLIVPLISVIAFWVTRSSIPTDRDMQSPQEPDSDLKLAQQYMRAGRYELAIPHYRAAAGEAVSGYIGYQLANAQFRSGDPAGALVTLDTMGPVPIQHDPEFVPLLRAEVLVALGRKEEAAAVYAGVMPRPASSNAFCHHADLLLNLGRRDEAREVLEHLERRIKQPNNPPGDRLTPLFQRAMDQLRELRD